MYNYSNYFLLLLRLILFYNVQCYDFLCDEDEDEGDGVT